MGAPSQGGHLRRTTLIAATALTVSGFAGLVFVEQATVANTRPLGAPRSRSVSSSTTWFDFVGDTTTGTQPGRKRASLVAGRETARGGGGWGTDEPSDPSTGEPTAQFDVAVPAAGAQVSAGEGDGSCTTAQMTALTPEGCPEPSGEGPVIIRTQPPGGGGDSSADTARFASFAEGPTEVRTFGDSSAVTPAGPTSLDRT